MTRTRKTKPPKRKYIIEIAPTCNRRLQAYISSCRFMPEHRKTEATQFTLHAKYIMYVQKTFTTHSEIFHTPHIIFMFTTDD